MPGPLSNRVCFRKRNKAIGTVYLQLTWSWQSVLIEGTSIRSTERITGLHRDTILKLLVIAGENCEKVLGCLIVNGVLY